MQRFLVILLLAVGYALLAPSAAEAQTSPWSGSCIGTGETEGVATIQGLECLVGNVLAIALTGFGLVMFILLLIGGLKYLTAGADQKALESAKGTLTWAIGGLVLAVLAWFILVFIGTLTGVNVTNFKVGI